MKLEFKGAYRDHGRHVIHSSSDIKIVDPTRNVSTGKEHIVVKPLGVGISIGFDGSANLNKSADYQFSLYLSDEELLALFEAKFGLETTVLEAKKELFGRLLKMRQEAGLPALRLPAPPRA
jgi:hypothetical protein